MKTCYPIKNKEGKDFSSLEEMMQLVNGEPHGTWLLGINNLWHGGIHLSSVTQPNAVLTDENIQNNRVTPIQCMAEGEIVAYRLGEQNSTALYYDKMLSYSSSFVLVQSMIQPNKDDESTWLTFHSLYLHLAPLSDYRAFPCYKVTNVFYDIPLYEFNPTQVTASAPMISQTEALLNLAPTKAKESLHNSDRFLVLKTQDFSGLEAGKLTSTPLALIKRIKNNQTESTPYWVKMDANIMEPDGEMAEPMPNWVAKAKAKGTFNSVVLTGGGEEWKIKAGDPVGFMGCTESPGNRAGTVDKEWFVHLEVLSADPKMPDFLSNPKGVNVGRQYIRPHEGKPQYLREEKEKVVTFRPTDISLPSQDVVLAREATTPYKDDKGVWWFKTSDITWLPQSDVMEFCQYDFLKLGFQPFEENSAGDVTESAYESWVPETFKSIAQVASKDSKINYVLMPRAYRDAIAGIDRDKDQRISTEEVRQLLTLRDPLVMNVVNHFVVKHHSEWLNGRSTRWEGVYKRLDAPEAAYATQWQTDLEWMSQVPPYDKDEAVWHFHPVVFLEAVKSDLKPSLEEARVRAFMRMLRVGEGTVGDKGYETLFGGQSFIKDYHKDFSDHPQIPIKRGKLTSSAAGAYQVMGYVWEDTKMIAARRKYEVTDFSPISQDKFCVIILKTKRKGALSTIMSGDIDEALNELSYEWASLPPGRYGQPAKTKEEAMRLYNDYLKDELEGNSDLHLPIGYITDILED